MEYITFKPLRKIKIHHEGYNMSFIIHPDHRNQYLATIRVSHKLSGSESECEYPMVDNKVYLVRLDSTFQVLESNYLLEPARKIYTSYTTGLEDCRLINGRSEEAHV